MTEAGLVLEKKDAKAPSAMRQKLVLAARVIVAIAVYWAIFRSIDITASLGRLTLVTGLCFLIAVVMILIQTYICAWRWRFLVQEPAPSTLVSFWAYTEGAFLNQAVPSTVAGDTIRILRWRAHGVSLRGSVASVFVDRLAGLASAGVITVMTGAYFFLAGFEAVLWFALVMSGLGIVALSVLIMCLIKWPRLSALVPHAGIREKVERTREAFVFDWRYARALAVSAFAHCFSGVAVWLLALGIGDTINPLVAVGVTTAIVLLSVVPISIAGWGVREAGFLALMQPLGIDGGDAVFIGLLFGVTMLAAALPGGLSMAVGWSTPDEPAAPPHS